MHRIPVAVGLALAWVGLALTWERWSGLSGGETTTGLHLPEAKLFLYALIAVSVLAIAFAVRRWKPLAVALTVAAGVAAGCAARAALDLFDTGGSFIEVEPGLGLWLSAAGALVLVIAARPPLYALALGAVALAAVAFWPAAGLGDGRIEAVATENVGETMALDGDAVLTMEPTLGALVSEFDPDGERQRTVYDLADVKSGFSERINGIARAGDDLYLTVSRTGLLQVPAHGKARMVAVGEVEHPDGEPAGNPQRFSDFHPSRIVTGPDNTVYLLSGNRVWRDVKGFLAPVAGTGERGFSGDGRPAAEARFDKPQDIAVDTRGRLYIADTGNGRVRRVGLDGNVETLVGASAPPACELAGGDEPESLDPTHCHVTEAITVDRAGNLFMATSGLPRVLALTANGRFGVVAGNGLAGEGMGDGRAVSAWLGSINKLAIGPDGDLYIGEFERALRVHAPLSALGGKPGAAPAAPREFCRALGAWGTAMLRHELVITERPIPTDALVRAIGKLDGYDELKRELDAARDKQDALEQGGRANDALRVAGEDGCGFMDGLYPVPDPRRYCATYMREWGKVNGFSPGDDRQGRPASKSAPLLGEQLFPPGEIRRDNWQEQLHQISDSACAHPYRWATGPQ